MEEMKKWIQDDKDFQIGIKGRYPSLVLHLAPEAAALPERCWRLSC